MKKLYLILLVGLLLLAGCNSSNNPKLDAPSNLKVNEDILTFDCSIEYNSYRLICVGTTTQKRVVDSKEISLNSLGLPNGQYKIYIQGILNNKESDVSLDFVLYEVKESMVNSISGASMVDEKYIKWNGRTSLKDEQCMLYNSLSGFEVEVYGTYLEIELTATNYNISYQAPYLSIVIDDDYDNCQVYYLNVPNKKLKITLDKTSNNHNIKLYKRSEALDSFVGVKSLNTDGYFLDRVNDKKYFMEVIGDSTIAGYGNETELINGTYTGKTSGNSNSLKTFAFLASLECNCDISVLCASGWGLTGSVWTTPETLNLFDTYEYTDPYKSDYYVSSRKSDVVIISVGTNDLYYIEKEQSETRKANFITQYEALVKKIRANSPESKIIMVYGVMKETRMYDTINEAYNKIVLNYSDIYLLKLEGDDGAIDHHPSSLSHVAMGKTLSEYLKNLLK